MSTHRPNPLSLYANQAPARWIRAAVAIIDDSLASLCARHWLGTSLVPIPVRPRRNPVRRP